MVIGVALIALGFVSAALLVDLLAESAPAGAVHITVLGHAFTQASPRILLLLLAAVSTGLAALLVALGFAVIAKARRRDRERARSQASTRTAGMEARQRLLTYRMRELGESIERLERKREELIRETKFMEEHPVVRRITGSDGQTEALVILPDLDATGAKAGGNGDAKAPREPSRGGPSATPRSLAEGPQSNASQNG